MAARFPAKTYRDWLIARYPRRDGRLHAGARDRAWRAAARSPADCGARAGAGAAGHAGAIAGDGDFFLVALSVTRAGHGRRREQAVAAGARRSGHQDRVAIVGRDPSRDGGATRRRDGDHVTVTTPAGSVTAPAYVYLGVRPDTVAVALGRGHTAYGRYAQGIGVNALDALRRDAGTRPVSWRSPRCGRAVAKAGGHSPLVTTEGSARQHGRGIAPGDDRGANSRPARSGSAKSTSFPGDASHEFLPGLRSPVANDAQGDLGNARRRTNKGMYAPDHWSGMTQAPLGDDDRSRALHRLLGVRHGLLRGEQHSDGGRALAGAGAAAVPLASDGSGWDARRARTS